MTSIDAKIQINVEWCLGPTQDLPGTTLNTDSFCSSGSLHFDFTAPHFLNYEDYL